MYVYELFMNNINLKPNNIFKINGHWIKIMTIKLIKYYSNFEDKQTRYKN